MGFKPSYGRISTAGIIPLSPSLDHVGTFTVDVVDAALMAATLWPRDQLVQRPRIGIGLDEATVVVDLATQPAIIGVRVVPELSRVFTRAPFTVEVPVERLLPFSASLYEVEFLPEFFLA